MEIRINHGDCEKDRAFLHQKVQAYNKKYFEEAGFQSISVCMQEGESTVAGLAGIVRGDWLLVQELWVSESLRGQGIGRKILQQTEEEAKKRGCQKVLLDTFEFQAPDFYKKQGYEEVFVYQEHPITGHHYYLSKKL